MPNKWKTRYEWEVERSLVRVRHRPHPQSKSWADLSTSRVIGQRRWTLGASCSSRGVTPRHSAEQVVSASTLRRERRPHDEVDTNATHFTRLLDRFG